MSRYKKTVTPLVFMFEPVNESSKRQINRENLARLVSSQRLSSIYLFVDSLITQKYETYEDAIIDLFEGMTEEQIQQAIDAMRWAYKIKYEGETNKNDNL